MIARDLAEGAIRDYAKELPSAVRCFEDDFERRQMAAVRDDLDAEYKRHVSLADPSTAQLAPSEYPAALGPAPRGRRQDREDLGTALTDK